MENYQKRVLVFRKKPGQSRLFTIILMLIAIYAFAEFGLYTIDIFLSSEGLHPISAFVICGTLSFSLAMAYLAFVNLKRKEISSKITILLIWIAISWRLFLATMELYPWNIPLAILFFLPGPLTLRRSQWQYISKHDE
jgi:hypothetical protein